MKNVIILISLLLSANIYSQTNYSWSAKPVFSTIATENKDENVIGIFFHEKYEYEYADDGELQMIHTLHKKFRLNNDDAIDQFNKISVSLNNVIELIDIKARTIKPNGKTIEFDKNNIKEIKDEDSHNSYKIFAIDGIEKGDDVEYMVIRKMEGSNFGRTFFQYSFPLQLATFEIISPKNLIYDVKGYNGFPNASLSELDENHNSFKCEQKDIPSIKNEKFSYLEPRKQRIEYRLNYNTAINKAQRLTWDDAAIRVYETMYLGDYNEIIDKWIQLANIDTTSEIAKIKSLEQFIKTNIYVEDFNAPELSDLEFIYENKVAGTRGDVKLYANMLKQLGIEHNLVLTSERDDVKFDADFQSWNFLDKYLIYFPKDDTYLDPSIHAYRLGTVNSALTATDGLFIVPVKIGDFESAIGKIKYIEPTPDTLNYDNMVIDIQLDIDNNTTKIKTERGLNGLSGGYISNFIGLMDAEQKQNTLKQITSTKAPNPIYNALEIRETSDKEPIKNSEFIIYSDLSTDAFLENAGNKILFNIGESIGPQTEMYFEENRTSNAENDWNRMYIREITFHVPEGYKIINPEVTKMSIVQDSIYGFVSDYVYNGDIYSVRIKEYYKNIMVKPEEFEGFKNVINAAADFNKAVLVLQEED
ncbi:DUF3857 domain-containing protein [Plebeiibacterium sediminum]|uniref:DUF3857 domain-containing protein n=1 Tax=Plebeiibacterium sediminum TaxID=2992112 RepID=A0AAE3M0Y1_9BACT|nr:DUF3857 domain-containing protein [Plebeiobacterium sediminum]MCW3785059.1 DUF3857 domain-containing protein [Plebeiobacterium sediminum]